MEYEVVLKAEEYDLISLYESQILLEYTSNPKNEFTFWTDKLELFMNGNIEKQLPKELVIKGSDRLRFVKLVGEVKITITDYNGGFVSIFPTDLSSPIGGALKTKNGEWAELFYKWPQIKKYRDAFINFWETSIVFPGGRAFIYFVTELKGDIKITFNLEKQKELKKDEIFITKEPDLEIYDMYRKQEKVLEEDFYKKYRKIESK